MSGFGLGSGCECRYFSRVEAQMHGRRQASRVTRYYSGIRVTSSPCPTVYILSPRPIIYQTERKTVGQLSKRLDSIPSLIFVAKKSNLWFPPPKKQDLIKTKRKKKDYPNGKPKNVSIPCGCQSEKEKENEKKLCTTRIPTKPHCPSHFPTFLQLQTLGSRDYVTGEKKEGRN